ncbi:hypothetical protein J5N97_027715 [Dioscorea zingiberensis]|uniref:BHLH domain-containing protein n=1 Tax=Dioscorea zingiberensis TaxID=325984 RepID=A0A9D5BXM8_9LILI|nr:hypothetical protein J5N97_027715 [Dioscorea zingiberensis]
MNREVFQRSSSVKQIMGGSPCWWNSSTTTTTINSSRPSSLDQNPNSLFSPSSSSSSSSSPPSLSSSSLSHYSPLPSSFLPSLSPSQVNHPLPLSWSQLLLGGVQVGEEELYSMYLLDDNQMAVDVKREKSFGDGGYDHQEIIHGASCCSSWSQVLQPVSSPNSCLTTSFSSNIPDFSKRSVSSQPADHSSECNSRTSSVALKKAKIQPSSTDHQSSLKVIRKEKLGDRVAVLHQLVSPFGKTDTASVLQEAIGYIRFLHSQIEALSSPYLASASVRSHSLAQGERSCIFVEEDHGDEGIDDDEPRDLKSRGLCLVPVSITLHVGNENGADYWSRSCT